MSEKAIIIGAGPAGLTAAYELLKRTDIKPIILEKSGDIGGISKTINYKGNRMDIGGHRFFSKSDRVMKWWLNIMPLDKTTEETITINYQNRNHTIYTNTNEGASEAESPGLVMLLRKRLSRIYFLRRFFNYPVQLSIDTLRKLGFIRTVRILLSYLAAKLMPRKPEKSLEDFLINRFGRELYLLFFKDYTEKVWGVPCNEISAEWGAQRIKGVSISKAIQHAAQTMLKNQKGNGDISQKGTETSLIEQFLYPALGPGQLWEEVARKIEVLGGTIMMNQDVKEINSIDGKVTGVIVVDSKTGETVEYEGEYFFSTMPVKELISGLNGSVPADVKEVAAGLQYRDFITVGVLLEKLSTTESQTGKTKTLDLKDTWIYIQEKDVKVGRLQLFNNWSPYMVNKPGNVWIGMEYFCNKGDGFWELSDEEIKRSAISELEKMGLAQVSDVLDSTVHRVEKTYPAYFGTYNQFDKIKDYVDQFENLFLVGRNGMHKYNNSDHSMLTAMVAVDNIVAGTCSKENIWSINTEQEYHEEKPYENRKKDNSEVPEPDASPALAATKRQLSFKDFLLKNKRNKFLLGFSAIAILFQLGIFKFLYPFASFINGDSYVYLQAANENLNINTYPIGYSRFLRFFSVFSQSDTALVGFQYLLLQVSTLSLLFTIFYFYKPSKAVQILLLVILMLNPASLYLSNYISSDSLFLALSLIWFTLLLWIIHSPTWRLIIWHGLVLFLSFAVRYNALFYPLISVLAFLLSNQRWWIKIIGPSFAVLIIGLFILHTGNKYKELTGTWQFSPFSGWQIANNAMYAYRYVDSADRKPVPQKFGKLDAMIRAHFDTTQNGQKYPIEQQLAGTVYMWTPRLPLQKFSTDYFKGDSTISKLKRWATFGPFYSQYGWYLIKHYPSTFVKYYIWPNALRYYTPPIEFLEQYGTGKDSIHKVAKNWFGYKTSKTISRIKDDKVRILNFLPMVTGFMHLLFVMGLIGYVLLQGYQQQPKLRKAVWLVTTLWLANFSFSVFASPIALRFQLLPFILSVCFASLYVEYIIKTAMQNQIKPVANQIGNLQIGG